MPRIFPSVEVRPLAGLLWYGIVFAIIIGALFAGGLGGAAVWIAFWILVALVAYIFVSRTWGRLV